MTIHAKDERMLTQSLNRHVECSFLDVQTLVERIALTKPLKVAAEALSVTHPHLFSPSPVFISRDDVATIEALVATIESVAASTPYRDHVLAGVPEIARFEPGAKGVFFGYDFHLSNDGPRLIEINTNAGGAYLNWALLEAQKACCDEALLLMGEPLPNAHLPATWHEMFRAELGRDPAHIAIVDEHPERQYLYPEFLIAQAMETMAGTRVSIVDPSELTWTGETLLAEGAPVDLVYNRLTDFYFEQPAHVALKAAYLSGKVVVTPHPRAHVLFANKANLAILSDRAMLAHLGVSAGDAEVLLRSIPSTQRVKPETAGRLWAERKHLFFKPVNGFGSRAAYRGDKITSRVWQEIVAHDYVAQEIVRPPERVVRWEAGAPHLKFDLRAYSYAGRVQLFAARLYDGQTTNFRTEGGGFAPVFLTPGRGGQLFG
ncbi:MAG: hypothetical protein H6R00_4479 [Proteobacteria bacterium]|nr:hypothetical protein [Pseudomonadota bacterium]